MSEEADYPNVLEQLILTFLKENNLITFFGRPESVNVQFMFHVQLRFTNKEHRGHADAGARYQDVHRRPPQDAREDRPGGSDSSADALQASQSRKGRGLISKAHYARAATLWKKS